MKPEYLAITFDMGMYDSEIWLALLGEWPFESFHEEEGKIIGYIQQHDLMESLIQFITEHQGTWFVDYTLERVPDKNWNEVWESSFNPVAVDDYCFIRAEFHPVENNFKHVITISPKMAFGTGHHATTYMMIQAMQHVDFVGRRVLDYGCGTGILGILAAKEGAHEVIGVDIQEEAIENSLEHAAMNGVTAQCDFFLGGLEMAGGEPYDIILANINRNVIVSTMAEIRDFMVPGGTLLISGIMTDDIEIISNSLTEYNLNLISKNERDHWLQLTISA